MFYKRDGKWHHYAETTCLQEHYLPIDVRKTGLLCNYVHNAAIVRINEAIKIKICLDIEDDFVQEIGIRFLLLFQ